MARSGFNLVYPQWDAVENLLEQAGFESWEAEEIVEQLFCMVIENAGMKELLAKVEEELSDENEEPIDKDHSVWWQLLEHALCSCWAETGIAILKGNSRQQVVQMSRTGRGSWASQMNPTGQASQVSQMSRATSVFEVAADDGYVLEGYRGTETGETGIDEKPGNLGNAGMTGAAGSAWNAGMAEAAGNVVGTGNTGSTGQSGRTPVKVDPNAFCPCGSGKRYRQCCGRKRRE